MVIFALEESLYELWSIWYQGLGVPIYRLDSKDGILADVGMSMDQAISRRGQQWFKKLRFPKFTQKAQSIAPYIFIWMLQVVANAVASLIVRRSLRSLCICEQHVPH